MLQKYVIRKRDANLDHLNHTELLKRCKNKFTEPLVGTLEILHKVEVRLYYRYTKSGTPL